MYIYMSFFTRRLKSSSLNCIF